MDSNHSIMVDSLFCNAILTEVRDLEEFKVDSECNRVTLHNIDLLMTAPQENVAFIIRKIVAMVFYFITIYIVTLVSWFSLCRWNYWLCLNKLQNTIRIYIYFE
jgi:hypothetical protein